MALVCEWFAMCANATTTAAPHPVLGLVLCCTRCAERSEIAETDLVQVAAI